MNNHDVACIISDLLGDDCACNFSGNEEWLPQYCDFTDTACPDPGGIACWEQYLKHLDKKPKTKDNQAEKQKILKQIKAIQDSIKSQFITAKLHNKTSREQKTIIGESTFTLKSGKNAPNPREILGRHNAMKEQSKAEAKQASATDSKSNDKKPTF